MERNASVSFPTQRNEYSAKATTLNFSNLLHIIPRVCLFKKSPSLQLALQALEPKSPASLLQTSALYVTPLRIRIAIYLAIKHRVQLNHITQQSLMLQFPDGR